MLGVGCVLRLWLVKGSDGYSNVDGVADDRDAQCLAGVCRTSKDVKSSQVSHQDVLCYVSSMAKQQASKTGCFSNLT